MIPIFHTLLFCCKFGVLWWWIGCSLGHEPRGGLKGSQVSLHLSDELLFNGLVCISVWIYNWDWQSSSLPSIDWLWSSAIPAFILQSEPWSSICVWRTSRVHIQWPWVHLTWCSLLNILVNLTACALDVTYLSRGHMEMEGMTQLVNKGCKLTYWHLFGPFLNRKLMVWDSEVCYICLATFLFI